MTTSKVADNGQVTVPKSVLEQAGIGPGAEVTFKQTVDGSVLVQKIEVTPAQMRPDRFDRLRGIVGPGPATDEIMAELRGD